MEDPAGSRFQCFHFPSPKKAGPAHRWGWRHRRLSPGIPNQSPATFPTCSWGRLLSLSNLTKHLEGDLASYRPAESRASSVVSFWMMTHSWGCWWIDSDSQNGSYLIVVNPGIPTDLKKIGCLLGLKYGKIISKMQMDLHFSINFMQSDFQELQPAEHILLQITWLHNHNHVLYLLPSLALSWLSKKETKSL